MSNDSYKREQDFYSKFERKERVCRHIHGAINSGNKMSVYPLCIQTYDDGYEVYWYCDECIQTYGMSPSGIYVCDSDVASENDVCEYGQNPFTKFLIEQEGWEISRSEFRFLENLFSVDRPLESGCLLRVPFTKLSVMPKSD
ncbi:hypothetical protein DWB84_14500 [Saccharophagus sp. K07]|nr:hypothetical protein [Saccharophagus sp. K07]